MLLISVSLIAWSAVGLFCSLYAMVILHPSTKSVWDDGP